MKKTASSPYSYPPLAPDARGGFVTAFLPDYPGGDWVCITDFCGSSDIFGLRDVLNVCAWWSPSRGHVAFGGQWIDVPPMPASKEPSEEKCWAWVRNSDTIFARQMLAHERMVTARNAKTKAIDDYYKANGYNWVTCELTNPDGSKQTISQCVGLRTWQETLRAAGYALEQGARGKGKYPKGTKITKWHFETGLSELAVRQREQKKRA